MKQIFDSGVEMRVLRPH